MDRFPPSPLVSRRGFLARSGAVAAGAAVVSLAPLAPAQATPQSLQAAIRALVGDKPLASGKVTLDVPPLVENGNTVPLTVSVESPMTAADHVTAIHVFNEKNPQPNVMDVALGPRAGRASVSVHIKLADSQKVVAVAELSDGSFWSASAEVIVTIAACTEEVI